jgi:hypothetical protein
MVRSVKGLVGGAIASFTKPFFLSNLFVLYCAVLLIPISIGLEFDSFFKEPNTVLQSPEMTDR